MKLQSSRIILIAWYEAVACNYQTSKRTTQETSTITKTILAKRDKTKSKKSLNNELYIIRKDCDFNVTNKSTIFE